MNNPTVEECQDEHPIYTREDYQQDIGDGSTNLDYWEWVEHRRQFYIENPKALNWHMNKFKTFHVEVEGSERHIGEKGYIYVVEATSAEAAGEMVLEHHKEANEDRDVNLLSVGEGLPPAHVGHWNDLR
jgi:hypothetical protein